MIRFLSLIRTSSPAVSSLISLSGSFPNLLPASNPATPLCSYLFITPFNSYPPIFVMTVKKSREREESC